MRKITVSDFAEDLGISRNTAKRLFQRGVFPREWVERSRGGKWFVLIDSERLPQARRSLKRWSIIRRRPDASKALPDPLSLEDLALELFCLRLFNSGSNIENIDKLTRRFLSGPGKRLYNQELEKLKEVSRNPENQAVFLIASKLLEFQERYEGSFSPTPKDLADLLHCSVASLYRRPFGRDNLKAARTVIDRAVKPSSISDLEELEDKYGSRLTARRIRGHLLISLERAEELLAERRMVQANTSDADSDPLLPDEGAVSASFAPADPLDGSTAALNSGYSVHQPRKPRSLTLGERERKRVQDRTRRKDDAKLQLVWELDPHLGGFLLLYLIPSRAAATVALYEKRGLPKPDGESTPSKQDRVKGNKRRTPRVPSEKSYRRALARMESKRESLGCVLPDEKGFCRRLFIHDGVTPDKFFPTLRDAVEDLHRRLRSEPETRKLDPKPDWVALMDKATTLWENHCSSASSPPSKR
ncbi:MAG: AraC family transcriptional regulator [Candidatus Omnitrophica bacterium]|nr:AraC family transcriptional regulator [Candidatus Omnitrophota bacterium]